MYYIVFKLISDEGFSNKEGQEELGCSERTVYRLLASCKEALYIVYGDDKQVVYSRRDVRYKLLCLKSKFNLRNISFLNYRF